MIVVKEVKNKSDLKKFLKFPLDLYKDCPYYVPSIYDDDRNDFLKNRNPNLKVCNLKSFLAYKDHKIVGRIAFLTNPPADEKFSTRRIRFRHFDVIDDFEVTKALFKKGLEFLKETDSIDMEGPNGFTDFDKEGLLIEGFNQDNLFFTYYNYPYYQTHLEKLGLIKKVDWNEYRLTIPNEIDPRLEKLSKLILSKGYNVIKVKNYREIKPYISKAFDVYNKAFSPLYGTVTLNEEHIKYYLGAFLPLLNLDYISIVENKEHEVVGFAVVIPSLGNASKKCRGKLIPFGIIPFLKALTNNDTIDMLLIAVKPQLHGLGINAILMHEILKTCIKYQIKYAETGPELEENTKVSSQWKQYNALKVRKRRLFYITREDLTKQYE